MSGARDGSCTRVARGSAGECLAAALELLEVVPPPGRAGVRTRNKLLHALEAARTAVRRAIDLLDDSEGGRRG